MPPLRDSVVDTLLDLMALPAPSGQEEPVLAWCRETWSALGADVETSPIGNVYAHIAGSGPRLLLQGHADEISFIVRGIDERGFIWLSDGQGSNRKFHSRYPVGQAALVLTRTGAVPGVFASPTGHILSTREGGADSIHDTASTVFVDIGVDTRFEAEALGVHPGAGVIWTPESRRMGHRIVGKAIDNRVSLALMTHLIASVSAGDLTCDLTIAATVQEEIGLVGALSLGTPEKFDLAVAIDNGPIADYPGTDLGELPVRLGSGPTIVYKDSMVHYDRRIIDRLHAVATTNGISVQPGVYSGFGSDGAALMRSGVPTALVAVSTRYTHSPFEMADARDVESSLDLLRAFVTTPFDSIPLGPS